MDRLEGHALKLNGCARCGDDHTRPIFFAKMTHPVRCPHGEVIATHWAKCPTNNEPILMRFEEEGVRE